MSAHDEAEALIRQAEAAEERVRVLEKALEPLAKRITKSLLLREARREWCVCVDDPPDRGNGGICDEYEETIAGLWCLACAHDEPCHKRRAVGLAESAALKAAGDAR